MQRMKKSLLRPYFTLLILCVLVIVSVLTWGIAQLIDRSIMETPSSLYVILMSVVLGGTATAALTQWILDPVLRLNEALSKVANGDFSVRLPETHNLQEIRDSYRSFNAMVQALQANDSLQADFISNVSHEFKTPINAIEGYAMLLQENDDADSEQQEYIEKILFNTHRLSDLVGNILLITKAENQGVTIPKASFRLDEQIRMAIVTLEHKWSAKDIDLDAELEDVTILGNESFLSHVWINLIDNAIKFDPQGGIIRLRLSKKNGMIRFTISDSGPGICEADKAHIFEKFFQADCSHAAEGNGLGLALVKRIVDIHRGNITVENLPEGGCEFTVTLPG